MHKFRSKLERTVWESIVETQPEVQFESIKLPYLLECDYHPDFILPSGILLEVKGRFQTRPCDRRKMLAVKRAHPDLDIRFVFMKPTLTITPKSKTTYAAWSEANGFPWCNYRAIPPEWLL